MALNRQPQTRAERTFHLVERALLRTLAARNETYWFNSWQNVHDTEALFALWHSIHDFIDVSRSFQSRSRVATDPWHVSHPSLAF